MRTNKVQGMEELEEDMHYKLPAMDDRDIDLSLLTAVLCSSEQVGRGGHRGRGLAGDAGKSGVNPASAVGSGPGQGDTCACREGTRPA